MIAVFKYGLSALMLFVLVSMSRYTHTEHDIPHEKLSEYGFFVGNPADLKPAPGVHPYEVNAPLFSDYAEKSRMIYLPEGAKMGFEPKAAFHFPTGAVIIKNFFYPKDARYPEQGRRLMETRLLIREKDDWKALVYVWNDDQTDASLEIAGATLPVTWMNKAGKTVALDYIVPNLNQCKGCHSFDGQFVPIGPTARQLSRMENGENQLVAWHKAGLLDWPADSVVSSVSALFDYRTISDPEKSDPKDVAAAARAYLDSNCSYCHNPHGPASTSGLFLEIWQHDTEKLGIGKPPVAAGRGSGKRKFDIAPGKPNESILVFRMENGDPGIRMPELGRQLAHKEGIELVKSWIKSL